MSKKPELDADVYADVVKRLSAALEEYNAAEQMKSTADSAVTLATNKLNEVQREFDAIVSDAHKTAPWNTDWHTKYVSPPRKIA